jgi:hypothetical protein
VELCTDGIKIAFWLALELHAPQTKQTITLPCDNSIAIAFLVRRSRLCAAERRPAQSSAQFYNRKWRKGNLEMLQQR